MPIIPSSTKSSALSAPTNPALVPTQPSPVPRQTPSGYLTPQQQLAFNPAKYKYTRMSIESKHTFQRPILQILSSFHKLRAIKCSKAFVRWRLATMFERARALDKERRGGGGRTINGFGTLQFLGGDDDKTTDEDNNGVAFKDEVDGNPKKAPPSSASFAPSSSSSSSKPPPSRSRSLGSSGAPSASAASAALRTVASVSRTARLLGGSKHNPPGPPPAAASQQPPLHRANSSGVGGAGCLANAPLQGAGSEVLLAQAAAENTNLVPTLTITLVQLYRHFSSRRLRSLQKTSFAALQAYGLSVRRLRARLQSVGRKRLLLPPFAALRRQALQSQLYLQRSQPNSPLLSPAPLAPTASSGVPGNGASSRKQQSTPPLAASPLLLSLPPLPPRLASSSLDFSAGIVAASPHLLHNHLSGPSGADHSSGSHKRNISFDQGPMSPSLPPPRHKADRGFDADAETEGKDREKDRARGSKPRSKERGGLAALAAPATLVTLVTSPSSGANSAAEERDEKEGGAREEQGAKSGERDGGNVMAQVQPKKVEGKGDGKKKKKMPFGGIMALFFFRPCAAPRVPEGGELGGEDEEVVERGLSGPVAGAQQRQASRLPIPQAVQPQLPSPIPRAHSSSSASSAFASRGLHQYNDAQTFQTYPSPPSFSPPLGGHPLASYIPSGSESEPDSDLDTALSSALPYRSSPRRRQSTGERSSVLTPPLSSGGPRSHGGSAPPLFKPAPLRPNFEFEPNTSPPAASPHSVLQPRPGAFPLSPSQTAVASRPSLAASLPLKLSTLPPSSDAPPTNGHRPESSADAGAGGGQSSGHKQQQAAGEQCERIGGGHSESCESSSSNISSSSSSSTFTNPKESRRRSMTGGAMSISTLPPRVCTIGEAEWGGA